MLLAVLLAGVFSVWAAILYFYLRHAGLMALALFAPLPFLFGVCLLWRPISIRTEIPAEIFAIYAYVFGVVLAQLIGGKIVHAVCGGQMSRVAVWRSNLNATRSIGSVILCLAIWMLAAGLRPIVYENLATAAVLTAALVGTCVVMGLAAVLPYSEQFITRANQARERRERLMDHFLFIAEPRWSWSLAGVALIFAALSAFGMRPLRLQVSPHVAEWMVALAIFVFAGAVLVTRNWRVSIALILTLTLLGAFGFWAVARGAMPLTRDELMSMTILFAAAAVPLTVLACATSGYLRDGDDIVSALSRCLQEYGADAILLAESSAVPWIILTAAAASVRVGLVISVVSCVAVPLFFPALAGAIYALVPRYRTVDEVFGRR